MGQGGGGIARRLEVVVVVALLAARCADTAQEGGSTTDACTDTNPVECTIWAKDGQCKSNAGYMRENCKLTCHVCQAAPSSPPASSSRSSALPALTVAPLSTPPALTTLAYVAPTRPPSLATVAYVVPTTTLPIPVVPTDFRYVATTNQICSGLAYTDSKAVGCNGWPSLDVVQCQEKCSESAQAPNCPRKKCLAAAFFSSSGWCHLFEAPQCRSLISEQFVTTLMKTQESVFDNPVLSKVKKTLETPIAQDIMKGTAVAAAVGVAAAGVEAALATRNAVLRSSTIAPPGGDGLFLDSPSTTNMLDGVPPPPSFRSRIAADAQTTTSAAATAGNSLSAPGGSFGSLPLWLPLVVVCCCCLSALVTAVAFKSRQKYLSRPSSYSQDFEEEDEDYVSEGQD